MAQRLPAGGRHVFFDWPGLGLVPARPDVREVADLVRLVVAEIDRSHGPVDLVGQSMGGLVTLAATLARPARVGRLVLTATSGGLDVAGLGGEDWRPEYYQEYPLAARWIGDERMDLSDRLPALGHPALLLWGDADPISPLQVGRRLASLLPGARLVVIPGGDHMFGRDRAEEVAPHVARHLAGSGPAPAAGS